MNGVLALAAVALFACGAAVAADPPATTDKSAAPADKSADKEKGPKKGSDPIPPRASTASLPSGRQAADTPPSGAAPAPAKGSGLEAPSARDRPATAATPMTGTRALPKKDGEAKGDAKGGAAEPKAGNDGHPVAPKKADSGLEQTSARERPATQPTPATGTRGIARPAGDAKAPAEAPAPPPKQ